MSTRCHIELYDVWNKNEATLGVRLYHHSDGYPEFMMEKLVKFLLATQNYLAEVKHSQWWDSERVGSVLILLSAEDYKEPLIPFSTDRDNSYSGTDKPYRPERGLPVFQPCLDEHGDIEYVWKVFLNNGAFKIAVFHANGKAVASKDIPEGYGSCLLNPKQIKIEDGYLKLMPDVGPKMRKRVKK